MAVCHETPVLDWLNPVVHVRRLRVKKYNLRQFIMGSKPKIGLPLDGIATLIV